MTPILRGNQEIFLTEQQQRDLLKKRRTAFPTIIGLAATAFGLDQITKFLVLKYIPYGQSWDYLPWLSRLFKITYIKNTGAAFGTFPQMGTILLSIAVLVVVGIVIFYHHLPVENFLVRASLGLQLGGAMGNLIDRIIHGFVVDFIDISFWPIFNIADVAIVTGVAALAYILWEEGDDPEAEPPSLPSSQADKAESDKLPNRTANPPKTISLPPSASAVKQGYIAGYRT